MVEEYALEKVGQIWQLRDGSQTWGIDAPDHNHAVVAVGRMMRGWIQPRRLVRVDGFTNTYSVLVAVPEFDTVELARWEV